MRRHVLDNLNEGPPLKRVPSSLGEIEHRGEKGAGDFVPVLARERRNGKKRGGREGDSAYR